MHAWDQMKPRTVYEKAVQDFTETAQQLARLNQHFRQASFAEFEMLMGFDDEVLKRYGLPKPMVERARPSDEARDIEARIVDEVARVVVEPDEIE